MPTRLLIATTIDATLESFMLPFADHFRSQGWVVDGAAAGLSANHEVASHFDQAWEMVWSRSPLDGDNLEAIAQIREIVTSREYDIVHVHTPVAGFITRLALKKLRARTGVRVVYTAHGFHCRPGGNPVKNRAFAALERTAAQWTDALVVINHEDERLARRLGLGGRGPVYYMPGIGIDLASYSKANTPASAIASVRDELHLRPGDALFLVIAAFDPGKRHIDAVKALKLTSDSSYHLAFAGTGPEMDKIRELTAELGLAGNVHFLGQRADIQALLAVSAALVHPSLREGLPRSVMEAMAMGTPVIGTRIRGTGELLSGGAGALVDVMDVEALAAAMRQVVREPDTAKAWAARAQARVSRYAIERVVTLHDDLYQDLLDSPPRRSS
jgi:glycosyltransferase involved in cell wall biosynthesis